MNRTALNEQHRASNAKLVDFHGWEMPLHYGSQLEEHHAVRRAAGVFDVSHMTVVDVEGEDATAWLRELLANDVARLEAPGCAQYTALLDEDGGILDDLIVYRRDGSWRLVVNSATREKDLAWMRGRLQGDVALKERADLSMLAVQGPEALNRSASWLGASFDAVAALAAFTFLEDGERMIARTGYTGEDGFEVVLPHADAQKAWEALLEAGIRPAGLGARDTLRLEAGMNLYGQDMDASVTPLESNMGWVLALDPADRAFAGRAEIESRKAAGVRQRLCGVVLEAKGVLRVGQALRAEGREIGTLTSGAFSPSLGCGIGLARIDAVWAPGKAGRHGVTVEIRGKELPVRLVRPPFVRNGKAQV